MNNNIIANLLLKILKRTTKAERYFNFVKKGV